MIETRNFKIVLQFMLRTSSSRHVHSDGIPVNQFIPATFLCLSQAKTWISNVICCGLFYVQWFEVIGDCLFCWYWWNCWPSLFKLEGERWKFVLLILVELLTITV